MLETDILVNGAGVVNSPDWTEPGAYEVAPGIHRIPLPLPLDGLRAVNVYVLESEEGLTLIDGGWAIEPARRALEVSLRSIGHHPRDIASFLVTHSHRDHYTQAVALRREFGRATVLLGEGDRTTIEIARSGGELPYAGRLLACGATAEAAHWQDRVRGNRPDPALWQAPDRWLEGAQELQVGHRTLAAIPTPGHTAGHFVFADHAAQVLFAGDHVLPSITPAIGFEAGGTGSALADYLASLETVRRLPDLQLLPAHGDVSASSHARASELLRHHEQRLALSLAAVHGGARTPYQVALALPWTRHERAYADLGPYDGGLAVMETRFHLDVLVDRGLLTGAEIDGVLTYELTDAKDNPSTRAAVRP